MRTTHRHNSKIIQQCIRLRKIIHRIYEKFGAVLEISEAILNKMILMSIIWIGLHLQERIQKKAQQM